MRLLLTGSSGFLGRNFLLNAPSQPDIFGTYFSSRDFLSFVRKQRINNFIPLKCNLTNFQDVKKMSKRTGTHFDVILYLSGHVNPADSVFNPLFDLDSNVKALMNVLENFSCKKFIFFSSGAVYDGLKGYVSPRSFISPTLPYAISKLTAENYVKFYHSKRKSLENYIILRFFGAYGPYEPPRKIYTKLVKTFAIEKKKEFIVFGNGKNYIDAMYIDDAISGIQKVVNKKVQKSVTVDFGTGSPKTIDRLVRETARIFKIKRPKIKHIGTTAEYISFYISNNQMQRLFSFKPTVNLENGLFKLYQHLKINQGCKC